MGKLASGRIGRTTAPMRLIVFIALPLLPFRNQEGVKGLLSDFLTFFAGSLLNKWASSVAIEPFFAFGCGRWAGPPDRDRHAAGPRRHSAIQENRAPFVTYFRARVVISRVGGPPPLQFRKIHRLLPLGWPSLLTVFGRARLRIRKMLPATSVLC